MRLLVVFLVLAVGALAQDEDFTPQGEEKLAQLRAAYCERLVRLATWDDKVRLHDEARDLCDRALLLLPDHADALALLEKQKGKCDDAAYPDHKSQKDRMRAAEEHHKRLPAELEGWRKEALAVATWCEQKHLDDARNRALRLAVKLLGGDEFLFKCLGYGKGEYGWVLPAQKDLIEPMSTYVYSMDEAARAKAKEQIDAVADVDLLELQRTATLVNGLPDLDGKGAEEKEEVQVDGEATELYTRVPIRYKRTDRWPAYITLHPKEGKSYFWVRLFKQQQNVYDKYIVLAPTLITPDDNLSWRTDKAMKQVDACVKWMLERYNVDTDRVFVDGFGIGAAAFLHAQATPDRYAGVILRSRIYSSSQRPSEFGIANLMHLPTYFLLGSNVPDERRTEADEIVGVMREQCVPLMYRIIAGKGEDAFTEESNSIFEWIEQQGGRDVFPRRVTLTPNTMSVPPATRAYWIEAVDAWYKGRIDAAIKGNTIEVTATKTKEYAVWLSDAMVDLDQPVKIVTNGETTFEGKVERDRWVMLDHMRATRDRMRTFVARVSIKVPYHPDEDERQKEDK